MFDKNAIEIFTKKAKQDKWLLSEIEKMTIDNVKDINNVKLEKALIISEKQTDFYKNFNHYSVCDDFNVFDGKIDCEDQFDVVFSLFNLHKVNNIRYFLKNIEQKINHNGFFFGSIFGDENAISLCESMYLAYEKLGLPFVNHFLPVVLIQDLGSLLQSVGFCNIVLSNESFKKQYASIKDVFFDIKEHGEQNCLINRVKSPIKRKIIDVGNEIFLEKFSGIVEYKVITIFCQKK